MECNITIKIMFSVILMTQGNSYYIKFCNLYYIFAYEKLYTEHVEDTKNNRKNKYHLQFLYLEITMIKKEASQLELCVSLIRFLKVSFATPFRKSCSYVAPLCATPILRARPKLCRYIYT